MDMHRTVDQPIKVVFDYLATPGHLRGWLPEVLRAGGCGEWQPGSGATFELRLRDGEDGVTAVGDVVIYEPPWQVVYRLCEGPRVWILRITCTTCANGTCVQVHQGAADRPLLVDLTTLAPGTVAPATLVLQSRCS